MRSPVQAADKQDLRKVEPFLVAEPQTIALAKQGRVSGTHKTVQNLCDVAQSCAPKISRAKTAIT